MKGKDYSRIINWFKLVTQNHHQLVNLIEVEKFDTKVLSMTFNVIKCGLFSKNLEVTEVCARTLNKLAQNIFDR